MENNHRKEQNGDFQLTDHKQHKKQFSFTLFNSNYIWQGHLRRCVALDQTCIQIALNACLNGLNATGNSNGSDLNYYENSKTVQLSECMIITETTNLMSHLTDLGVT